MSATTDSESQFSDKMSSPVPNLESAEDKDVDVDEEADIDVTSVASEHDPTSDHSDDEYFKPIKKLCMAPGRPAPQPPPPPPSASKPLSSFFIKDILNHKPSAVQRTLSATAGDRGIVRPWDLDSSAASRRRPRSADDDSRSERSESDSPESPAVANPNTSPLDALFEMTSKAFEGLEANEKASGVRWIDGVKSAVSDWDITFQEAKELTPFSAAKIAYETGYGSCGMEVCEILEVFHLLLTVILGLYHGLTNLENDNAPFVNVIPLCE